MAQPPPKPSTGPGGPPAGPGGPPQPAPQSKRLQQTQAQVDEVVDIMKVNFDKVLERDQKLSELDDRADALQYGASQFEASAGKLKRKFWWKNMKMMLIIGGVVAIVVVILGVWIYNKFSGSSGGYQEPAVIESPMSPGTSQTGPVPPVENIPPANPGGGRRGKGKQPPPSS